MLPKTVKLYYPSARDWMWNYCIYLGPYTDSKGANYDLGIYIDNYMGDKDVCAAIVYGNEPGQYISGDFDERHLTREIYIETAKRAKEQKLM